MTTAHTNAAAGTAPYFCGERKCPGPHWVHYRHNCPSRKGSVSEWQPPPAAPVENITGPGLDGVEVVVREGE